MQHREVDWHRFWLLEVVILAVPVFVTVLSTAVSSTVSPGKLEVLLVVLGALTVLNLFWGIGFAK